MLIGLEAINLYGNVTGTGRYIKCLYDTLNISGRQVIPFAPFKYESSLKNKISKNYYRQFKITGSMNRAEIDCAIFPDYFLPLNFNLPAAIVIHDLSFISHPEFYSRNFVKLYKKQLSITLRKNPLIITVSEYSKHQIIKYLNIDENNIHIVQGYVEKAFPKTYSQVPEDEPYFLYAGHIEPRKNLDFLIRNFLWWRSTRNIGIKLKIVGQLWINSKSVSEMIKKYQDNPYIEFTGYVTDEKLNEFYKNAAGFVHTSLEEGFGFPVLEAMSYNLPVLCSESIATSEISGPSSIKINPLDDSDLIKGLDQLYAKYLSEERTEYKIPFSRKLMSEQLQAVINRLEEKSGSKIKFYYRASNAEEGVEKSLVYSGLFNSGIKKSELPEAIFDVRLTRDQIDPILIKLTYEGKIINNDEYIKLIPINQEIYKRSHRNVDLKKTNKILTILNRIPFICSIAFSGGTANYGIENHDDIDLFIITRSNTVNIVYFILHLLSLIFGVRSRLCANYLVDETRLKITGQRDFYTAHQIISLKPYKDNGALGLFIFRNGWVNNFFPNFRVRMTNYKSRTFVYSIFLPINLIIMNFYKIIYRVKLKGKNGSLYFTSHSIKLHSNDHREKIIRLFNKEWERYKSNSTKIFNNIRNIKTKAL